MSEENRPIKIDALIFDMDGVLVNVKDSYRQAIIQTVDLFFNTGLGLAYEDEVIPLLDEQDVDQLKMAGGFNNDWDITTAFIIYFLEMLPPFPLHTFPIKKHVPAILAYLQAVKGTKIKVTMDMLRQNKDIYRLARMVKASGGGLNGINKALTHRNRHLIKTGTSLLKGNLIKRIFQELYLGETLFEEIYGEQPVVAHTAGLINNEKLLISRDVLNELKEHINLGIATGRPKAEAQYTLKRLNISQYFGSVVTHDDVLEANARSKPDPWSLLESARRLHPTPARSAYIGDTPDDVRAAKAANEIVPFTAIGCLAASPDQTALRQRFINLKADLILHHPDSLLDVILE